MDSIVEENGNSSSNIDEGGHNLTTGGGGGGSSQQQQQQQQQQHSSAGNGPQPPPAVPVVTSVGSVLASGPLQYLPPAASHGLQVQSVIQAANQSSVIQTAATNAAAMSMPKTSVLFVAKPNTVIHSSGNVQLPTNFPMKIKPEPNTQHLDTNSDDSYTDEDSPRRRRELTRRPSYHKIFNEISGPDISGGTALQMQESGGGMPTITSTGVSTSGTHIHLPQDGAPTSAFYLPTRISYTTNNNVIAEDQTRKREIRLQKNREAARECRRKKKEYIKCLENRVAVLENQNKALIEELKSLKELYCQTKND